MRPQRVLDLLLFIAFFSWCLAPALLLAAILSIPSWALVVKLAAIACFSLGGTWLAMHLRRSLTDALTQLGSEVTK